MIHFPRLMRSFKHASAGLYFALAHNQNLRIHFVGAAVVISLSIVFDINPFEMGILGVMILLVICAEMINTALEEMVNLITKEHRKEAKIAKDVAAGMVMVTSIGSVIVGILIFIPHFVHFFNWHF